MNRYGVLGAFFPEFGKVVGQLQHDLFHVYLVLHYGKPGTGLEIQAGMTFTIVTRRMNRYGVLGAFFPEFGKVVGQLQHDLFHVYTVHAHSLFVVRNLRRLAALCHDIGKGSGRDYSEAGAQIALSLCGRLGLSEYDTRFVA